MPGAKSLNLLVPLLHDGVGSNGHMWFVRYGEFIGWLMLVDLFVC